MTSKISQRATKSATKPVVLPLPVAPAGTAPDTPPNYQTLRKSQAGALRRPTAQQAASTGAVAAEVGASTTFEDDFGKKAPVLGPSLTTAAAWSEEADRAQRWADYAADMSHIANDKVLGEQEAFKKDYAAAVHHDPTIAERYPTLSAFVTSRHEVGLRSAATRKQNKKAAAAKAPDAAAATTTTPTSGAPTPTNGAASSTVTR